MLSARLDNSGLPAALWVDSQRTDDRDIAFPRERDTSTSSTLLYHVAARLSDDGIRAAAVADLNGDGEAEPSSTAWARSWAASTSEGSP